MQMPAFGLGSGAPFCWEWEQLWCIPRCWPRSLTCRNLPGAPRLSVFTAYGATPGYAVGGLTAGLIADSLGVPSAIIAVAGLTFLSGILVAGVMAETHRPQSYDVAP